MPRAAYAEVELAAQERLQQEDNSDWLFWKDDENWEGRYVVDEERKSAFKGMPIHGISALTKPENRANLLRIYLVAQGEDIETPTYLRSFATDPKSVKANELKKFLMNEDNVPEEEWQGRYLDIFGSIY